MTPKEKALELIDYYKCCFIDKTKMERNLALITADKIIEEITLTNTEYSHIRFKYWQEVKKEINNYKKNYYNKITKNF